MWLRFATVLGYLTECSRILYVTKSILMRAVHDVRVCGRTGESALFVVSDEMLNGGQHPTNDTVLPVG